MALEIEICFFASLAASAICLLRRAVKIAKCSERMVLRLLLNKAIYQKIMLDMYEKIMTNSGFPCTMEVKSIEDVYERE